ncbi:hypothetical protein Tco_1214154 [Tanacetum coccineum]
MGVNVQAASKEKEKGVELKDVEEIDRPRPTSTRSLLTLNPLPKIDPKDKRKKKIEEEDAGSVANRILAGEGFKSMKRSKAIQKQTPNQESIKNQMMTILLKHVGEISKHYELKELRSLRHLQAMYEKIKRSDENFIAIGSVEDDRLINKMNKKDSSKEEDIKKESKEEVEEEDKGEEDTRKRKLENDELRLCLTIAPDEDKEVDYEILDKKYPIIDWKTENLGTKPQFDESKRSEEINMNDEQDEFWNSQHEWKVVSWKLHSSSGVHTLMTDEGLVVHMLIEKKYPLKKEIVVQMLKLKLESEKERVYGIRIVTSYQKVLAD